MRGLHLRTAPDRGSVSRSKLENRSRDGCEILASSALLGLQRVIDPAPLVRLVRVPVSGCAGSGRVYLTIDRHRACPAQVEPRRAWLP